ncbi:MAG: PAS domain S-box protein [Gemmatimonadales bacterium]|nr:PAS domain S-box protein [Gemmatimonadales bacterium]
MSQLSRADLESALRKLMTIVDSSLDAVITMDASGAIVTWNAQAAEVFGWSTDEVTGRALADIIVPAAVREHHQKGLEHFLATGEGPMLNRRVEVNALHRNGREFPVELTITPVREATEWSFTAFIRDLSERRHLEDQLRQSQRMEAVGQLAGGVAHDFNNLLTAILGTTDMALMDTPPEDPRREDFETIQHAARRAATLTQQLLAFSRKQVLQPRQIDLNAVVRRAETMLFRLLGENIEFVTELGPRLHAVKADPAQLEQVIVNLSVNARDAMPGGGRLHIRTRNLEGPPSATQGGWVELAVADTGDGMDDATKARMFEPFFTTKAVGKGTGLGLSTVYGIVTQSGGSIVVESEPGKGTLFIVRLPAVEASAEAGLAPPSTEPGQGGGETILVVEDEASVRSVIRRTLERHGYRVVERPDAESALLLVEQMAGQLDLILTDVIMPGLSGTQLAARVLARHPTMRVMLMSGYSEEAVLHQGVLSPGIRLLQKPFVPEVLLREVRGALKSRPA